MEGAGCEEPRRDGHRPQGGQVAALADGRRLGWDQDQAARQRTGRRETACPRRRGLQPPPMTGFKASACCQNDLNQNMIVFKWKQG